MARKNEDGCLKRAGENEMLFVLRAQDASAPKHVLLWLADNIETLADDRVREAVECALTMKREGNCGLRKRPD